MTKNWIQLSGGYIFDLDNIETNTNIPIECIAHSLSNQCRWGGNTRYHYSVAQHSVQCLDVARMTNLSPELQYEALMHDAAEAVMIDLPRPFKRMLPEYSRMLERVERFFALQFKFPYNMSPEVKEIDDRMLATEYHELIDFSVFTSLRSSFKQNALRNFPAEPYEISRIYDVFSTQKLLQEPWVNLAEISQSKAKQQFIDSYRDITSILIAKETSHRVQ